jgi:hypothetical protein
MIKDTNIQRSIVLPKELANKITAMAKENYTTFNAVVKQILIEYFKNK